MKGQTMAENKQHHEEVGYCIRIGSKPRNEPYFMLGDDMPRGVRVFDQRSDALAYKATMFDPSVAAVVKVRIATAQ
jgi:hypothetical protein